MLAMGIRVSSAQPLYFYQVYSPLCMCICCWPNCIHFVGVMIHPLKIYIVSSCARCLRFGFKNKLFLTEGQWEKKAVYTFYLVLICDLAHLSLYMLFFIDIFLNHGVPLHLIRELYETLRNFKIHVSDYVHRRKITSTMNGRFPDATADELNVSDVTCIICREEMTTAKKLLCGHLFHVHCLRSWRERQHTCPTCRSPIAPRTMDVIHQCDNMKLN
ncbi:ERAD-associated E3 ubiquitin-protein ligase HRD1 [Triticum aestivum]|uniref:ERAD-associated E3 ubiquitin-protein ligase HRD1 n=1 Tax=Triticum aestivum TaxID=4565 RepID=UPI001D02E9E9|nr:ERAD-associated E3 ubiquitin-protein ligase HRD1-like [Triticum aestivum]